MRSCLARSSRNAGSRAATTLRGRKSIEKATDESEAANRFVHLAAVYDADGTIQLYRDGQPYGKPYESSGPVSFRGRQEPQSCWACGIRPLAAARCSTGRIERPGCTIGRSHARRLRLRLRR